MKRTNHNINPVRAIIDRPCIVQNTPGTRRQPRPSKGDCPYSLLIKAGPRISGFDRNSHPSLPCFPYEYGPAAEYLNDSPGFPRARRCCCLLFALEALSRNVRKTILRIAYWAIGISSHCFLPMSSARPRFLRTHWRHGQNLFPSGTGCSGKGKIFQNHPPPHM